MCRLYGFRANERTKVECSLVHAQNALLVQSRRDFQGREHADGWGIACYGDLSQPDSRFPNLVRHKTAAFEDAHFSHVAETTYAQTVVAHVRLATVGYVGALNSHPFTYGGWTFAQNGALTGFELLARQIAIETGRLQDSRLGETDSEQFFLWMLNRMQRDGVDLDSPDSSAVERSVGASTVEIARRCHVAAPDESERLTFVLTNGRLMLACCWNNPLYFLERAGVQDCEICGIPHVVHDTTRQYHAALCASEPISDEDWCQLPDQSLAVIREDCRISVASLSEAAPL